jgi:hypothetical protein
MRRSKPSRWLRSQTGLRTRSCQGWHIRAQYRCQSQFRDRAAAISQSAPASEHRSWWRCDGTTSTSPPGACMCAGPRVGTPACIRYRPGKVGRCASSCAKRQHPHTSSCRNDAHLCPQPDISAWWPGRAWLRNSPFSFILTCCGTPAGSSSPTTATTLAPSKPISATARSCPPRRTARTHVMGQ